MTAAMPKLGDLSMWPRGLSRDNAALYVGLSPNKFDELVKAGQMPSPKTLGGKKLWDRVALDVAFEDVPSDGEPKRKNSWDV